MFIENRKGHEGTLFKEATSVDKKTDVTGVGDIMLSGLEAMTKAPL